MLDTRKTTGSFQLTATGDPLTFTINPTEIMGHTMPLFGEDSLVLRIQADDIRFPANNYHSEWLSLAQILQDLSPDPTSKVNPILTTREGTKELDLDTTICVLNQMAPISLR